MIDEKSQFLAIITLKKDSIEKRKFKG